MCITVIPFFLLYFKHLENIFDPILSCSRLQVHTVDEKLFFFQSSNNLRTCILMNIYPVEACSLNILLLLKTGTGYRFI